VGDAGADLQAQLLQMTGNEGRGLDLLVAQLGVAVNLVPVLDRLGCHPLDSRREPVARRLADQRSRSGKRGA
jgi:hypothetical protein